MKFLESHRANLALIGVLVVEILVQKIDEGMLRLVRSVDKLASFGLAVAADERKDLVELEIIPIRLLKLLFGYYDQFLAYLGYLH